jgi:hypothetical protein
MKVEPAHTVPPDSAERFVSAVQRFSLWKTMGKSLAEGSGWFQEKDSSPLFGIHPQFDKE